MEICSLPNQPMITAKRRRLRRNLLPLLFGLALFAPAVSPRVIVAQLPAIKVLDDSALHPPAGTRVAIIEFGDLQCPSCAYYNSVLRQAAEHYRIPWIRHDFIIPFHTWSRKAAVDARWFDNRSKALGDDYRDAVFADQTHIYNMGVLNQFTEKFAQQHGIAMPFLVDPFGKLDAEVTADTELGKRTGVNHTPTIFVVSIGVGRASYTQVLDPTRDLYQMIDQALAETRGH
jgi:protein-disulfide isomerase